jgi:hypothetical protein
MSLIFNWNIYVDANIQKLDSKMVKVIYVIFLTEKNSVSKQDAFCLYLRQSVLHSLWI